MTLLPCPLAVISSNGIISAQIKYTCSIVSDFTEKFPWKDMCLHIFLCLPLFLTVNHYHYNSKSSDPYI